MTDETTLAKWREISDEIYSMQVGLFYIDIIYMGYKKVHRALFYAPEDALCAFLYKDYADLDEALKDTPLELHSILNGHLLLLEREFNVR